jgi:hyperosmotically inducible periplasmic protein
MSRINSGKWRIFAVFAVLLIAGCAVLAQAAPRTLQQQIRHELVTLPYYGVFDNLAFKVDGGTVTLYGQVVRPITKSDAEHRVARLSGVNHVINNIEVLPLSPFDDSIRRRTYRAVFRAGSLYRYALGTNPSIHIIVDRGHVTLEGVVANKMDSQLAYMAANGVSGVFSVTNHLRVERGRAY